MSIKILLVEDDGAAQVSKNTLIEQHYLVNLALDGWTGLSLAETFKYDLIVLDVMLPKLDGIEFCKQLRQKSSHIPILILLLTALDSSTKNRTSGSGSAIPAALRLKHRPSVKPHCHLLNLCYGGRKKQQRSQQGSDRCWEESF